MGSGKGVKLYNQEKWSQISKLKKLIEDAAFKISLDRKKPSERFAQIHVFSPTKDRSRLSYKWIDIWNSPIPIEDEDADNLSKSLDSFIYEFAKEIWIHKKMINYPHIDRQLIEELIKKELETAEKWLISRRYRSETRRKVLRHLRADLNNRKKGALKSDTLQSEVSLKGHALVHREDDVIKRIKLLYIRGYFNRNIENQTSGHIIGYRKVIISSYSDIRNANTIHF